MGRLEMFFNKRPYTGFKNSAKSPKVSLVLISSTVKINKLQHYVYVTKKKVHHPNHTFCQC